MVTVISSQEFETLVLQAKGPILVDFFATWCGPCRRMAPVLEEVAAEHEGEISVYKVDIDASMDLAMKYQIEAVPTLGLFKDGALTRKLMGAQPKENLLSFAGL